MTDNASLISSANALSDKLDILKISSSNSFTNNMSLILSLDLQRSGSDNVVTRNDSYCIDVLVCSNSAEVNLLLINGDSVGTTI